jgi:2,3-dihydroxyphenylpropionate 1,2-dioxygenase
MIVGTVCMAHSPIMDRNRAAPEAEKRFWTAIEKAADFVAEAGPDLLVVFHPDHVNGFFYRLLPSFCVGIEGQSVGDFGTVAGKLNIPEAQALSCAESLLAAGIDAAISYRDDVDHGATQPMELLTTKQPVPQVIPIFINCALHPRPTMPRVRALGSAVGRWAAKRPERILLIGSGGLSHDPPLPSLSTAPPELRQRLIEGGPLTHAQRLARQNNVMGEGLRLVAGTSKIRPINPEWDHRLLESFEAGDLTLLDSASDEAIEQTGGRGGHEVRCWIAALAGLGENYKAETLVYEPIPEWITGMGVMVASPARV